MNRLGAITALRLSDDDLRKLFITYRDNAIGKSIYETLVMYRTIAVAMILMCLVIVTPRTRDLSPVKPWHLTAFALMLAVIFAGATLLQFRYLRLLADRSAASGERATRILFPNVPPPLKTVAPSADVSNRARNATMLAGLPDPKLHARLTVHSPAVQAGCATTRCSWSRGIVAAARGRRYEYE